MVEVRFDNDGQDPFPMFMSRHRCPKNRDDIEPDFPLGAMEITDEEVKEYFAPTDFAIGKTILVYGRRFLIYDVDNFTKAFYWKNFGMTDFTPVDVDIPKPPLPKQVRHFLEWVHTKNRRVLTPLMRRGNIVATDVWVLLMRSERDIAISWVRKQLHWYYARIPRSLYWAGITNA